MLTQTIPTAFQVHAHDNVATLLTEAGPDEPLAVVGAAQPTQLIARETIAMGHKVAVVPIAADAPVVKFNVVIGIAARAIAPGEWVHLHNCRSRLDERSGHFDVHTGEPGDNPYA